MILLAPVVVGVVTLCSLPTIGSVSPWTSRMSDYYNHPCKRECVEGAAPLACEYDFTIEYYYTLTQACHGCPYNQTDCFRPHCISADGVSRGVMTVNRMMPGPGIHVCLGDTIIVNVMNKMEGAEATTIHWHGVLQQGSPHMDGVAMITQCPIHAHSKFRYKFLANNAGTHYWHAHAGLQRAEGIFGALVIREPISTEEHAGLYNYDLPDHTIIINDWLEESSAARFAGHHHAMTEHLPASILINGHGTYHAFGNEPPSPHGVHHMSHESHMAENHQPMSHDHHMMSMNTMGSVTKSPEGNSEMNHEGMTMEGNGIHPTARVRENNGNGDVMPENMEGQIRSKRGTNEKGSGCEKGSHKNGHESKDKSVHTPHAVFYVDKGYRYRFRIISNGVNNCPIHVSVDNHTLIVISSDGSPFRPIIVESFNIFAGERYDFVLVATNPIGNYWIRTRGLDDCGSDYKGATQTAILRYIGASEEPPMECEDYKYGERKGMKLNSWYPADLPNDLINVQQLEACVPNDITLKPEPDRRFYLAMDFNMIENYRFHDPDLYPLSSMMAKGHHAHHMFTPQINHISFMMPSSPPLSQIGHTKYNFCDEESLNKDCTREFCECINRLKVGLGEVVELVLIDEGKHMDNNHPMHLHGHNFRVIGMAKLNSSTSVEEVKKLDSMGRIFRNLDKAPIKDTVNVPDGGYTIIRFHANNPGFWLFHCHIAFHMEMGMSLLIQVGEQSQMPRPPRNFPRCGDWTEETEQEEDIFCPPKLKPSASFATGSGNMPTVEPHYISNFHPPPSLELPSGVNITGSNLRYLMSMWLSGRPNSSSLVPTTMPTKPRSVLSPNRMVYRNPFIDAQ